MQLTVIRYVVTLSKLGSYKKAAKALYISQPALSQAIRRMEQEINAEIFQRHENRLCLTPVGEIIVAEGEKLLEIEDRLIRRVNALTERKVITIGAAISYQRYFLGTVLSILQEQSPDIHLDLQEGFTEELCQRVIDGELNFALVTEPVPDQLDRMNVFREEILLAVPWEHPLNNVLSQSVAPGDNYPVADLRLCRDEVFIAYRPHRRIQQLLLQKTAEAGFTPRVSTVCVSTESANTMIYHGMGISLVPAVSVDLCPADQRPKYYRLQSGGFFRTFCLISRAQQPRSREEEKLISIVRQLTQQRSF